MNTTMLAKTILFNDIRHIDGKSVEYGDYRKLKRKTGSQTAQDRLTRGGSQ